MKHKMYFDFLNDHVIFIMSPKRLRCGLKNIVYDLCLSLRKEIGNHINTYKNLKVNLHQALARNLHYKLLLLIQLFYYLI